MNIQNPLLQTSEFPFETTHFSAIKSSDFLPALKIACDEARLMVNKIKDNLEPATFENTLVALDTATEKVDHVATVFFNIHSAEATEEIQALAQEFSPQWSSFYSELQMDEKLFARIEELYKRQTILNLDTEQKQLLENSYLSFVRNGARLSADKKQRVTEITEELSILTPRFSENILKATNEFQLLITDKNQLKGLPDSAIDAAHLAAKEAKKSKIADQGDKGISGDLATTVTEEPVTEEPVATDTWLFNLQAPSYIPFMTYAENRSLREKLWKAYGSRALDGEFSNKQNAKKIAQLRHERAQILGFKSHADFVLQERMAETSEKVITFLDDLLTASKPAALKEIQELKDFNLQLGNNEDLKPWDVTFVSEKLCQKKYSFDQEQLRPYFSLDSVISGVFEIASRLYEIEFIQRHDIPTYHKDVQVYEVLNKTDKSHVGIFYADFFPRATKHGGAWATSYRAQGFQGGSIKRPHISIVCNFTKPTEDKPSLLSFDEVTTLFHEFGHALHGLLSQCTYRSLAGTNVYWDFVELPSQIMENWALEPEALALFARHYQTEEPLPQDLVEKLRRSSQFQAAFRTMRQLSFANLDMAWHSKDPSAVDDLAVFENEALASTRLLPPEGNLLLSVSFSHIFDGGYSAGYYSYKWAEVLDADAFEAFKENGILDLETARRFKSHILERGGSEHPMELYKKFRGREPDPKALLRRDGLI